MAYQLIDTTTPDVGLVTGANKINNNAVEAAYQGSYFTSGGTANAITLTSSSGTAPPTYVTGHKFRFRVSSTNTEAATINVDGLGIKTLKTISGADLPASYLPTDKEIEAIYDGVNVIVYPPIGVAGEQVPINDNLSTTVTGTASFSSDTYTFSPSGTGFRALEAGMYISFVLPAGSVNTTTTPDIDYNGTSYTIKWIDGSALAANDLDVTYNKQPIQFYFDGTDMLIASDITGQSGTDDWTRCVNGWQFLNQPELESDLAFSSSEIFVTGSFTKAFKTGSQITMQPIHYRTGVYAYSNVSATANLDLTLNVAQQADASNTTFDIRVRSEAGNFTTGSTKTVIGLQSSGRWY